MVQTWPSHVVQDFLGLGSSHIDAGVENLYDEIWIE
jgi:hypothetical protein